MNKAVLLFAAVLGMPIAQGSEEDLYQLSFEELLDVNISIASKTSETRASVPSSTTVFNAQQIASLGVDNVYELMNYVPGFQSTRGDWVGAVPKEHTRGVYLDTGHVLVMIDGQRLNESSFGKASVYTPFIPVDIVAKVEFIRGPGSALYGSNAFLGVMNVITKTASNEFSVGYGEHGTLQMAFSGSRKISDDTELYGNIAANQRSGEGYFQNAVKDPLKSLFITFGGSHRALSWQLRYNRTELDEFLNLSRYSPYNEHQSENIAAVVSYDWQINPQLMLSHSLSFIEHNIKSAGLIVAADEIGLAAGADFLVGPAWQSRDLTYNLDGRFSQNDKLDWNFGLEWSDEEQSQANIRTSYYDPDFGDVFLADSAYLGGVTTVKNYAPFYPLLQEFDSYAGYLQAKYKLSDDMNMFAGIRYDEVKDIDDKLSPRLAFIYNLNPRHTLKFQYGESFRTPVSNELNSNDDVTIGNSDLTSERVKTTEFVWHYQDQQKQLDVVLFENQLSDFINLIPINDPQAEFTFGNVFETNMQGIEVNANLNLSERTWLQGAFTQMFDKPLNGSFKKFFAAAITHQYDGIEATLNALWRDSTFVPGPPNPEIASFDQPSYWLLGLSLSWQLADDAKLYLKGENLTDKKVDVFDPRLRDGRVPQQGRTLQLQYHYVF